MNGFILLKINLLIAIFGMIQVGIRALFEGFRLALATSELKMRTEKIFLQKVFLKWFSIKKKDFMHAISWSSSK